MWGEKMDDGVDSYGEQQDVVLHFIQPDLPSLMLANLNAAHQKAQFGEYEQCAYPWFEGTS